MTNLLDQKRSRELTKAKNFQKIGSIAAIQLAEKSTMSDYELMIALNFSPPSWKTWKPFLIQYLTLQIHGIAVEKEKQKYKITYDKKQKVWNSIIVDDTQLVQS